MSELERCPFCGSAYRRGVDEPEWCRVCPEGLRAQPPDVQQYVRHIDAEYDRAEAEHYGQM